MSNFGCAGLNNGGCVLRSIEIGNVDMDMDYNHQAPTFDQENVKSYFIMMDHW